MRTVFAAFACLAISAVHAKLPWLHRQPESELRAAQNNHLQFAAENEEISGQSLTMGAAADYRVVNLPGLPAETANMSQYAGYITVDQKTSGNLFFWLVESDDTNAPWILWLNGGPGCSSMDGMFKELGPFKINNDLTLTYNPYSWHKLGSVVFLDQPVGTGLSFVLSPSGYAKSQDDVNRDVLTFLRQFLALFPSYASRPFYIAGESYAGHYIPWLSVFLLSHPDLTIDLRGVAIGNGWSDPPVQNGAYADFANGAGILDSLEATSSNTLYLQCRASMEAAGADRNNSVTAECDSFLDLVIGATGNEQTNIVNYYDIRLYAPDGGGSSWPMGLNNTAAYLALPAVQKAIHTDIPSPRVWEECDGPVGEHLQGDSLLSSKAQIIDLLDIWRIRVMLYSGLFDLICNSVGTDRMIRSMVWSGADAYGNASSYVWTTGGKTAGFARSAQNLTFVKVAGGSHMVPMDVPEQSLEMMRRFLSELPFADIDQGVPNYAPPTAPPTTDSPTAAPAATTAIWPVAVSGGAAFFVGLASMWCFMRPRSGAASVNNQQGYSNI